MADCDNNRADDGTRVVTGIRKLANEEQWEEEEVANRALFERTVSLHHCRWLASEEQWEEEEVANRALFERTVSLHHCRWLPTRIIGTALVEEASMYVRRKTDAKEIWGTLLSVFQQSSLQRLYTLFYNLFEMTKDGDTSVTTMLRKVDHRSSRAFRNQHQVLLKQVARRKENGRVYTAINSATSSLIAENA
ncbi:hypothetical protein QE152_g10493 [Popillia japonica]|uniref:Uncharacterized protein n=1 Tax=Popillia japonica TaxID=7064 RepID=A0AAW1LRA4_POPJA